MKIISIKDSIIKIQGAKDHFINQVVEFSTGVKGVILKASKEASFVVVDSTDNINISTKYKMISKPLKASLYEGDLGKILNMNGNFIYPTDSKKGKLIGESLIEKKAPMFYEREKLEDPLMTGIFSVDSLIPIGKGQRELIIGDRRTGKTSIALATIINQRKSNVTTIYLSIGQKQTSINNVYKVLDQHDSLKNTIILYAEPHLKLSQYLAPYIAMAYAEILQSKGEDVLLIIDDLSKHANIHRELSLNLDKPGGREAYPSDLFYAHSKLLERAGKFKEEIGGGTITCIPIIETVEGDFATLLATNVISITDGQIITDTNLATENKFPAINVGMSVSRTGSAVQSRELKSISKQVSLIYSKYLESSKYELISVEVSDEVRNNIEKGKALMHSFEQSGYEGRSPKEMILISKIIEWGALNGQTEITPEELIKFTAKDLAGKKLLSDYYSKKKYDSELIKSYFQSLLGVKNSYGGKRSPIEVKELGAKYG
ncbi:MAG: ATP F0F1 synthase subunit alpha [Mycoplasmataceae bacterium]|nr:ATP F0F1 synthase subunit alpha [Mycoplasmataceae bacterium]